MNFQFQKAVQQTARLTEEELGRFYAKCEEKMYPKGTFILDKGEVCNTLHFLLEGAVIQYQLNEYEEEIVYDLSVPNDWVLNQTSFVERKPSENYMRAFETVRVLSLTIHDLHDLIAESQNYLQLGKIVYSPASQNALFEKFKTPDERYLHLLQDKPVLLQMFPLKTIASYLGISPETLSRVRKRIKRS